MQESDFQDVDQGPLPEGNPSRFGLKTWNRRATIALGMAMLTASTMVYSRQLPFVVALLVFILFEWALLYGVFSAGLWTWRLITRNPDDKPLWNRVATLSVCVGAAFAAFSGWAVLYGPVPANPEVLPPEKLGPMCAMMCLCASCFAYGLLSAVSYRRKQRKAAQNG
jgi:predicted MFS family arabinose efflux permease